MGNQNIEFGKYIFKKNRYWGNLLIALFIALSIVIASYYFGDFKTQGASSLQIEPGRLVKNENYIQEKIDKYLIDNPSADRTRAIDVTYHDIATHNNDIATCGLIQDKAVRFHCYKSLR